MTRIDPLQDCLSGQITPEVAIARLLLAGETPHSIRERVQRLAGPGQAVATLFTLAERQTELQRLRHMLDAASVDHTEPRTPAAIAALFDRAVAVSPEGSVALYTLGDPSGLQLVTTEIIYWLREQHLLGPEMSVLDLGCGIGRMAVAVAPYVRFVVGTDVSLGMMQEARRRRGTVGNISFAATCGQDLAAFSDACFDLVLAVDSFPYLVQAGVADRHVSEVQRVLRTNGFLVVLNLSYRSDICMDQADAGRWAEQYEFTLHCPGSVPFRSWDARAWIWEKTNKDAKTFL